MNKVLLLLTAFLSALLTSWGFPWWISALSIIGFDFVLLVGVKTFQSLPIISIEVATPLLGDTDAR